MNRIRAAACAAIMCALVAAAPAAAETGDSAPIRPLSDGGLSFPDIAGAASPEEYPYQLDPLSPALRLRQVSDQEVVAEYIEAGYIAYSLKAEHAHDANGATVPTTVALTEDEEGPVLTLTVHFRAGNPAAGGSAFEFPIMGGDGWEGGRHTISFELNETKPPTTEPPPAPSSPAPTCTVPSLHGFGLPAVKKLLRGADCRIGRIRLSHGSAKATGKVVKQFEPAGTQLAPGAPVAVKLAD
jgi:hypothetical protein